MIELKIIAANDNFSGATEIYTVYEDIDTLAKSLKGFPKSISESIEFSAGQRDSNAFANIRFYCFTEAGHPATRIELESNVATEYRADEKNKIQLEIQFEPAALDSFVSQLSEIVINQEGKAVLDGISRYTQNIV